MMAPIPIYFAVGAGAGLGAAFRYLTAAAILATGGPVLLATALVNVAGSFIIGVFAGLTGPNGRLAVSQRARAFIMAGFCGGLTTFSALSLETVDLLRHGGGLEGLSYIAGSIGASLVAVWAGHRLGGRRA